jgi:large subunit ribosomal protein L9
MKVIMLKDVGGVGRRDEVKEVSDGFAMNSLIPQGKAVQATPERLAALEARTTQQKAAAATSAQQALIAAKLLDGATIRMVAKANDQRHLYKQISREDIAREIAREKNISISANHIAPLEHIKSLGEYDVVVTLEGHTARVHLAIEAQ